eukprot:COSAG02_NODE_27941_length_599_cov_2.206000_2_plen_23_part_01
MLTTTTTMTTTRPERGTLHFLIV